MNPDFMNLDQTRASKLLGISTVTLKKAIRRGENVGIESPFRTLDGGSTGRRYVTASALQEWLDATRGASISMSAIPPLPPGAVTKRDLASQLNIGRVTLNNFLKSAATAGVMNPFRHTTKTYIPRASMVATQGEVDEFLAKCRATGVKIPRPGSGIWE